MSTNYENRSSFTNAPLLLVDDDPVGLGLLQDVLQEMGFQVETATDGEEALERIRHGDFRIVLSDWQMPEMSGIELCRRVRRRQLGAYVYFILLTSMDRNEGLISGLQAGADDFISKPFDPQELQVRLRVAERIVSLESRDLILFSLAKLAEARDQETGAHLERMREYAKLLAEHLATTPRYCDAIDGDYVRTIYLTSPLHDIGKVGIPDSILLKPGRLTADEFEIMKQHTLIGAQTLDAAMQAQPSAEYLRFARDIICSHHEKFNGAGYPYGLAGTDIPLCGRLVAVADVYDALTTKRVYKDAFSHEKARSIILGGKGTDFDPDVVDAFLAQESKIIRVREQLDDSVPFDPSISQMASALPASAASPMVG